MRRGRQVRSFLNNYFEAHKKLPTGCHDIDEPDQTSFKIGVVDFDDVRKRIHGDLKYKDYLNYKNWIESGDISKFQMSRDLMVGFSEQAAGNNPNEVIYNMRQRLARRERPDLMNCLQCSQG